jgi:hypothetical protein
MNNPLETHPTNENTIPKLGIRTYKLTQYKEVCPKCNKWIKKLKNKTWKCYECGSITKLPLKGYIQKKTGKRRSGRDQPPLTQEQISIKINSIPELKWRAFFSTLYLTGCRIRELTPYKKRGYKGLTKGQIELKQLGDKSFLVLKNVPILKRRIHIFKNIPLPLHCESGIVKNLQDYVNTLQDDEVLFPFYRQLIYRNCAKYLGKEIFPHLIRHFRASILVADYGFQEHELVHFIGWNDSRMASTYVHLNWESIAKKMN